ncbi:MAG: hypothetical protein EPN26_11125 [Rhodospirillales bacterium]|nr:MAG: hypothetical protein EPN26_11125 [Rhodospirillales bacterium]
MLKKTTLAIAIALAPSLALAATGTTRDFAPVSGKADAKAAITTEQVRDMLAAQGALHVSPVKRIRDGVYETKILTTQKGWTKVYVDARTGKMIDDPLLAFRKI